MPPGCFCLLLAAPAASSCSQLPQLAAPWLFLAAPGRAWPLMMLPRFSARMARCSCCCCCCCCSSTAATHVRGGARPTPSRSPSLPGRHAASTPQEQQREQRRLHGRRPKIGRTPTARTRVTPGRKLNQKPINSKDVLREERILQHTAAASTPQKQQREQRPPRERA